MSEDLKRVKENLDKNFRIVFDKLDAMNTQITTHKVLIETCGNDSDALKDTVHGNGKAGLVIEVDRIKTTLKNTGIMRRSMWTNAGIIFSCVGVATAIIFSVMTYNSSSKDRFYKKDGSRLEKRISYLESLKEEMNDTN